MRLIMTLPARRGALHFLARVATDESECPKTSQPHATHHVAADIRIQRLCTMDPAVDHKTQKHSVPCPAAPDSTTKHSPPATARTPAFSSSSSSSSSTSSPSPPPRPPPSTRTTRSGRKKTRSSASRPELESRLELRKKRQEVLQRAKEIKSLDNSPVNDRQLLVLRMVYDEITMYPSESWMSILAVIIHRAFKQVKNWFANERQKRGGGDVVSYQTETGDKLRLRSSALGLHKDWSDNFFEEVAMIHNYRVLCNSGWQTGRAPSDTTSNFDGHS